MFPLLRRRCQERGIAWSEVDLRWGVTTEQAAEGAVLPICLAEIERTRPYFIGLLGQGYGWVPGQIDPDLAARFGWLTDDLHRSVTELEILHGVLNNPDAAGHAYFYLRDPAWVNGLPSDHQALYSEPDPPTPRGSMHCGSGCAIPAFRSPTTTAPTNWASGCWPTSST